MVAMARTRYERGSSEPDFATASKLANELGVPLAYLIADDELLAEIILAVSVLSISEQRKLAAQLKAKKE